MSVTACRVALEREGGASRCGDRLRVGDLGVPLCAAVAVCLLVAIRRAPVVVARPVELCLFGGGMY